MTVKCVKCLTIRPVPHRYLTKYYHDNWKEKFICYKFKLRNIVCDRDTMQRLNDHEERRREVKQTTKNIILAAEAHKPIFKIVTDTSRQMQRDVKQ